MPADARRKPFDLIEIERGHGAPGGARRRIGSRSAGRSSACKQSRMAQRMASRVEIVDDAKRVIALSWQITATSETGGFAGHGRAAPRAALAGLLAFRVGCSRFRLGKTARSSTSGPAFAAPGLSRSSGMAPHASSAVRGAARFAAMAFPLGLFRCLAQCVAPGSASLAICLTAGALAFRLFSG